MFLMLQVRAQKWSEMTTIPDTIAYFKFYVLIIFFHSSFPDLNTIFPSLIPAQKCAGLSKKQ